MQDSELCNFVARSRVLRPSILAQEVSVIAQLHADRLACVGVANRKRRDEWDWRQTERHTAERNRLQTGTV